MYEKIRNQVEILREYPKLGRVGRVKGTRELVISGTPYVVVSAKRKDAILIVRVLHGRQQWPRES